MNTMTILWRHASVMTRTHRWPVAPILLHDQCPQAKCVSIHCGCDRPNCHRSAIYRCNGGESTDLSIPPGRGDRITQCSGWGRRQKSETGTVQGCGVRVPRVWILAQGRSPNFLKIPESESESCQKWGLLIGCTCLHNLTEHNEIMNSA